MVRNTLTIASQQQQYIDSPNPAHRLTSQMAGARGHESVFALVVKQAAAQARLAEHRHQE